MGLEAGTTRNLNMKFLLLWVFLSAGSYIFFSRYGPFLIKFLRNPEIA